MPGFWPQAHLQSGGRVPLGHCQDWPVTRSWEGEPGTAWQLVNTTWKMKDSTAHLAFMERVTELLWALPRTRYLFFLLFSSFLCLEHRLIFDLQSLPLLSLVKFVERKPIALCFPFHPPNYFAWRDVGRYNCCFHSERPNQHKLKRSELARAPQLPCRIAPNKWSRKGSTASRDFHGGRTFLLL